MTTVEQPKLKGRGGHRNFGTASKIPRTEQAERRAKALTMRNAGRSWEHISDTLGVSTTQCMKDVTRALKDSVKLPGEQLVDRQNAILNDLLRVEYAAMLDPSNPRHYPAITAIMKALEHQAKLLGLYAPTRVNLGISQEEFGQRLTELQDALGGKPLGELIAAPVDAEVIDEEPEPQWSNL